VHCAVGCSVAMVGDPRVSDRAGVKTKLARHAVKLFHVHVLKLTARAYPYFGEIRMLADRLAQRVALGGTPCWGGSHGLWCPLGVWCRVSSPASQRGHTT